MDIDLKVYRDLITKAYINTDMTVHNLAHALTFKTENIRICLN